MSLEYRVRFQPGNFFVIPQESKGPAGVLKYFNIVDDKTRLPIAFTPDENQAQTICLAMEFLSATVLGDRTRLREMVKLIDALKTGAIQ